jgi:hypothetical protein
MTHRNAPRACASKWVNRYRRYGDLGLLDRSSTPHDQLNATAGEVVARIEGLCRTQKWSAARISFELTQAGTPDSRRTVSRHLANLGLNRLRLIDPSGDTNREPRRIIARRPGHMVHVDVKKAGRIPDGGGCVPTVATATRPERSPGARRRPNAAATSTGTQPSTDTAASPERLQGQGADVAREGQSHRQRTQPGVLTATGHRRALFPSAFSGGCEVPLRPRPGLRGRSIVSELVKILAPRQRAGALQTAAASPRNRSRGRSGTSVSVVARRAVA